ncbi:MAG TPA: NUDIX domain-containing protein [Thermoanaerobaculia bacterium]|nr:NUDIX domain-containing protein [Thermoanaerobaculia bacterium]
MSGTLLVVAGIFVRDGRLLLSQRLPGGRYPGLWEFPGGKVQGGETPEEALVREWGEELDATPAGLEPDGFARDGDVTLLFFRVRALLGDPRPKGCAAVRWCDAAEARLLAMPPADGALAARLAEGPGGFRDSGGPETPALLAAARERRPFIPGSAALAPGRVVTFRKHGLPGCPFLDGLLVATSEGPRAFENLCPHVPIPLDRIHGELVSPDGRHLVCQNHGARFDLPSGRCVAGPCEGEALRAIPIEASGDGWAVAIR